VESGCLVLVDGWNHFIAARRCLGYTAANKFPLDRLAGRLAAEVGEDSVNDAVVVMALPDRNQQGEQQEFEIWRRRLNKLRNFGVRHERARFSYHDLICVGCRGTLSRHIVCPACGVSNPLAGRRKEKGADIKLATLALNGAWRQEYAALIVLSQDSDFGPMIQQVKEVHRQQGRHYALYSAFPVCTKSDHEHRGVPGARPLPIGADVYAALINQPYADCRTSLGPRDVASPRLPAKIAH
jgi:NYN domain-containing protein